MEQITRKDIEMLAKEYGYDAGYLIDVVIYMEGDGILVTAAMIEDYICDGTI